MLILKYEKENEEKEEDREKEEETRKNDFLENVQNKKFEIQHPKFRVQI